MSLRVTKVSGAASTPTATLRVTQITGAASTIVPILRVTKISGSTSTAAKLRVTKISGSVVPSPTVSAGPDRSVGAWDDVSLTGSPAGGAWTKVSGNGTSPGAGTTVTVNAGASNTPGSTSVTVYRYTYSGTPDDVNVVAASADEFELTGGTTKAMRKLYL